MGLRKHRLQVIYVYVRAETNDEIRTTLLKAKSKVAPLNIISIPRLELSAAALLAKLIKSVRRAMELEKVQYYLWTDSTIVLQWINKQPCDLKVFVGDRVSYIRENTSEQSWNHVKSCDNSADLVSRGLSPMEIVKNELWWHGPSWLAESQISWPRTLNLSILSEEQEMRQELKVFNVIKYIDGLTILSPMNELIPITDYSNDLRKILRIVAYVKRFIEKLKTKIGIIGNQNQEQLASKFPSSKEKERALKYLIECEQSVSYPLELSAIINQFEYEKSKNHQDKNGRKEQIIKIIRE